MRAIDLGGSDLDTSPGPTWSPGGSRQQRPPRFNGLIGIVADGYEYASRRCRAQGVDVWETRLGLLPVTWLHGADAASILYDSERFERADVLPRRVRRTLAGDDAVQLLDGEAHLERKALIMSLMSLASVAPIEANAAVAWRSAIERWSRLDRPVALTHDVARIHAEAALRWVGLPPDDDLGQLAADLRALYEGALALGPRHWRARAARRRLDSWATGVVAAVRARQIHVADAAPLAVLAHHHSRSGQELPATTAGAELLNLLCPIAAVERFVCFAALALHAHPHWSVRLRTNTGNRDLDVEHFIHEVRRLAPLFPAVGARVRSDFVWQGVRFPVGRLVLLDVYGTNRHPRRWERPDQFDPDRFAGRRVDPFEYVPQGGGDPMVHHRCAGEWITVRLLGVAVDALTSWMDYRLPPQDLSVSLRRVPALPRTGVLIDQVRPRDGEADRGTSGREP